MRKIADVKERLASIRKRLIASVKPGALSSGNVILLFSVSDGGNRARVVTGAGSSFEAAWQKGLRQLQDRMQADGLDGRWLRVEWVDSVRPVTWSGLRAILSRTKRNYFRLGISIDRDFTHAFTEQELNANAMLYGGNRVDTAVLNERNFLIYASQRYGSLVKLDFKDDEEVFLFSTAGVFSDEKGVLHELTRPGRDTGRRRIDALDQENLLSIIGNASAYLADQVNPDGRFIYGYHPCFDRRIDAYNTLRHASTTYSMVEAWEVTRDDALRAAIERSITYIVGHLVRTVALPDGTTAAFLVDVGDEIKLGGSAVAILALARFSSATGATEYHPLMEQLALGIRHMQDEKTGSFTHVLNFPDLSVKRRFRIIYYEGEAAFGLMRLYGLTGDPRWLEVVEKAFDHFIAQDHWKHHDHWLGYCVNELTKYRPEERYFRFGLRNVADYLDFVETRITTFPTLLELMMAARETISRIAADPPLRHLLHEIDLKHFEKALEKRAHYLLNGHFWPEMAMYHRNPGRIVGSFFIRHHAFRVRIDDVEHYLSGLIAYRRYLHERTAFRQLAAGQAPRRALSVQDRSPAGWTADRVEAATGGQWIKQPPSDWQASGLSTFAPAFQQGNLVVVRSGNEKIGMLPQIASRIDGRSGVIATDPELLAASDVPTFKVGDITEAVIAMGRYARDRMTGNVSAITGSAGKTTMVAMLSHALSPWGNVATSQHNANLPVGVGWNLASMPWSSPNVVLELAVGRMAVSSRMARPHVAIFTNILPAHLNETSTVADIARTKSAIFDGMHAGSVAIINRDMQECGIVRDAAQQRGLKIVWYGASDGCDIRLLKYDIDRGAVRASVNGRDLEYRIAAAGKHMALNSLAVLAAVSALGYPLEPALAQIETFAALPGRGEETALNINGRNLTIIDDAYNANPGSMKAALERLSDQRSDGRRIAVLGQMAELGPGAAAYHTELASVIDTRSIDRVYVTGELYADFWKMLEPSRRGYHAETLGSLRDMLLDQLEDGDTVLFKGSNSERLHELVGFIKNQAGV